MRGNHKSSEVHELTLTSPHCLVSSSLRLLWRRRVQGFPQDDRICNGPPRDGADTLLIGPKSRVQAPKRNIWTGDHWTPAHQGCRICAELGRTWSSPPKYMTKLARNRSNSKQAQPNSMVGGVSQGQICIPMPRDIADTIARGPPTLSWRGGLEVIHVGGNLARRR